MTTVKKQKKLYNYNYLSEYCKENKIILNKDYTLERVNRDTIILAKCIYCDNDMKDKSFRLLVKNKNYGCNECSKV